MTRAIDPIKRSWLKDARKNKAMTMREVAEVFGISFQHYSDIENGRRNPSIELSIEMANFFDVPIEKFLAERTRFKKEQNNNESN